MKTRAKPDAGPDADQASFALIAGIEAGVDAQLDAIRAEAEAYAADKLAQAKAKAREILEESAAAAAAQAAILRKNAESRAALERKKTDLAMRDRLVQELERRSRALLDTLARAPGYRDYVALWIAEAAVGLGSRSAVVNAGSEEWALIDDGLLAKACAIAAAASGRNVSLRKADRPTLAVRGVELVDDGGRLSYDNRVSTRFARAGSAIRDMVHGLAFSADGNDQDGGGKADGS